jgi:N-acetylmuramic acid 6-phosphate etherase
VEGGPANLRLLSDRQLVQLVRGFAKRFPTPQAIAIGLAGAGTEADRERIRHAADQCWPRVPCYPTNDLETGLAAQPAGKSAARVLVLCGTGSCCYCQAASSKHGKVGGWGHVLGDRGSGYEIGLTALKKVIAEYDHTNHWPQLGARILRQLQFNEPEALISWAQNAAKDEIAALAVEVFAAWLARDKLADTIVAEAARLLANDAVACARRWARFAAPVEFILAGGVLLKQPRFASVVARKIRQKYSGAIVRTLQRESVWGAVELAKQLLGDKAAAPSPVGTSRSESLLSAGLTMPAKILPPTEERNPRSKNLDRLPLAQAIALMLSEDAKIPAAIGRERKAIEQALRIIVRGLKTGGRLFYVGAGTSGRLGVLDASECPPTFRVPPDLVQGIMAGGQRAIWESVEGAEDDAIAGAQAMQFRGITRKDIIVGITASGCTPFVWGALDAARARGAATVLLCFNPRLKIVHARRPTVVIAINTGPEILTGSTRLKAGTATKLVLNIFTTLTMVKLGKAAENLMVDLNPSNTKLRDRAVRIVRELTTADAATARTALEKSGWVVKRAWARLKRTEA